MSTDIVLIKAQGGFLIPADEQSAQALQRVKTGEAIRVSATKIRNVLFHRKFFALLNLAYDSWEPMAEYKGEKAQKNFEQFRNDVVCLAGYHETTVTLRGDVRVKAKSISFARMQEDEFQELYNSVINVILSRILKNYSKPDLENVINQLISFT